LTNQNLAERDWRYYRFTIPRTGIPVEWKPFFNRISGSAVAYIRDTLPPFSYVPSSATSAAQLSFADWGTDAKNRAPLTAFLNAISPGTTTLPVPPLRPGSTYFLGIYGSTSGGSVDVSSSVAASQIAIDAEVAYNTGSVQLSVPAGASRLIRIATTVDASRLKIECLQSAIGLSLKLEQGSLPYTTVITAAHRQNTAPFPLSYTFNEPLTATWPFVPKRDYYLLLTNTTAAAITSTVNLLGTSLTTEDEDRDGLLDPWEMLHFGNLNQLGSGDFDKDGSTNLQEFINKTIPTDATSVLFLLSVISPGGSNAVTPLLSNYPLGTSVAIAATPAPGDTFQQWKSNLPSFHGSTNPSATLIMNSNVDATALFRTTLAKGLDAPASMTLTPSGIGQWYGQFEFHQDGLDAAVSPAIGPNQQSRFTTQITGPGTLSFWWRVSSRASSGRLTLLIDNFAQTTPAPISGTTGGWSQVVVNLPAGEHSIAWRYSRDSSQLTDGENRGYVDMLQFTPEGHVPLTYAGWRTARFTPAELADPAVSGPRADPDGDGIPNIVEAAVGSSPTIKDPRSLALSLISSTLANGVRTTALATQRAESPVEDLKLEIQASADLNAGSWTTLAEKSGTGDWLVRSAGVSAPQESAATGGIVPIRVAESVSGAAANRRCFRLAVSLTAP
jgi:hypothetical protein